MLVPIPVLSSLTSLILLYLGAEGSPNSQSKKRHLMTAWKMHRWGLWASHSRYGSVGIS